MIQKLILGATAALMLVGPADASELWAGVRNGSGNVSLGEYDVTTGNLVAGTNVFMDADLSGQGSPVAFDRLGAMAFDSDGELWAGVRNSFGAVSLGQYDIATGNLVAGTNVIMDVDLSGQSSPLAFDRLGAMAFDSDGELWAGVRNSFGGVSLGQYDIATGNLVAGTNVFMDADLSGQGSPVAFDRLGAMAFDGDGRLWAAVRNTFGNVSLGQYDLVTGNLIAGTNVFMDVDFSGQGSPLAFDRLGAMAFDSDGKLWAGVRNSFGAVSLGQYDVATGNLVAGTNVVMDVGFSGQGSPLAFDRLGAFAFGPDSAPVSGVPEPSTWALMIGGFFLVGAAHRQRRTQGEQVI